MREVSGDEGGEGGERVNISCLTVNPSLDPFATLPPSLTWMLIITKSLLRAAISSDSANAGRRACRLEKTRRRRKRREEVN